MKKILTIVTILALSTFTYGSALNTYNLSSCENIYFYMIALPPSLSIKTEAVFPNSSEVLYLSSGNENFAVRCPDAYITRIDGRLVMQFNSQESMLSQIFDSSVDIEILQSPSHDNITKKEIPFPDRIGIHSGFNILANFYSKMNIGDRVPQRLIESVIGYKLNDGKLTPMVYESKYLGFNSTPNDKVEFYSRFSKGDVVRHITFDRKNFRFEYEELKEFPNN